MNDLGHEVQKAFAVLALTTAAVVGLYVTAPAALGDYAVRVKQQEEPTQPLPQPRSQDPSEYTPSGLPEPKVRVVEGEKKWASDGSSPKGKHKFAYHGQIDHLEYKSWS